MTRPTKIITIADVRKRLGKKAEYMTDKELEDLLSNLRLICSKTIDAVVEKSHTGEYYEN